MTEDKPPVVGRTMADFFWKVWKDIKYFLLLLWFAILIAFDDLKELLA